MQNFFINPDVKNVITSYRNALSRFVADSQFEKERNEFIHASLKSFLTEPETWDSKTQVNIDYISHNFINDLKSEDLSTEGIDEIFSTCFRFVLEFYINHPREMSQSFISMKSFAIHQVDNFSPSAKLQIEYALREMPINILKSILHNEDFTALRQLPSITQKTENLKNSWDADLNDRIERINALEDSLKKQEFAFNFVGLYKGFNDLSIQKKEEYIWARRALILLGILLLSPMVFELIYFKNGENQSHSGLIKLIPIASLTLIFIYFFRIALRNFSSIKAQIVQIELRKSLCQFIQNYAEYSKQIKSKDHNPLEKFEEIVFSNIMPTEDKIPSTFDGLESLASLMNSLKNTK
ncbi:hypothetical protein AAGQ96_02875 [Pantoea sp. MBD-2R]|uniref:hypothetical protein n=1 Tax=Pantoea sp. MBD-2R TaxID=3141540 RepID=UPI003183F32D